MSHSCCKKKKCKCKKNCHPLGSKKNPYDFVIVGAGTAGAPLAKLLSDDFTKTVFVIEGGQNLSTDPNVLAQPAPGSPPATPKYDWDHPANVADMSSAQPPNPSVYTDGRMWGGSSGHNFGLTVRGTPDVYNNAWGSVNPQWAYNNLLPAMKYLETFTPNGYVPNPAQRGNAGPLSVIQAPPIPDPLNPFINAFLAMNAPVVADYNDPTLGDVGVSPNQEYALPGTFQRSWAASAFLNTTIVTPDGQGVGGRQLTIVSTAYAKKVLFDGTTAIGVEYLQGIPETPLIPTKKCKKDKEPVPCCIEVFGKKVILAAGAIVDAAILQRSGIGPSALLTPLGIPVLVDNPNVGANLQCHLGPLMLTPINFEVAFPPDTPFGTMSDFSGNNVPVDGAVGPATGVREAQYIIIPGPPFVIPLGVLTAAGIPHGPEDFYFNWFTFELRPSNIGAVEIQSADDIVEPLSTFRFYQDTVAPTELDKAVFIYKMVANQSLAYSGQMPVWPPASHYPVSTGYPGAAALDDTTLREDAKGVSLFANHACGTCRMATSAATGVVDGNLNVFGVQNLGVASNSVAPQTETGNTAWMAYIIGMTKAKIEGAPVPF